MPAHLLLSLGLVLMQSTPAADQAPSERDLALGEGAAALHGTLLAPAGRPVGNPILIWAGSGPTDRDGNSPGGVSARPYQLLAEGLAARGIVTLRTDKRGIAASKPAALREEELRIETFADDARAWASRLKQETGAPCIWILGHSEGALVAQLAGEKNADVCGLILVAGGGRKAGDVLREQFNARLPQPLRGPAFAAIAEIEAGRTTTTPPELAAMFRPSVQPYLISWFRYDPAEVLRAYDRPVLILQGGTDLQASSADAERLAAANPKARLVQLEGVNHVLKLAPADPTANFATYTNPALALAPGVVDAVADFVTAKPRD